jgi:hypothetical protein
MVKLLLDNYHGSRPVTEPIQGAYATAEKGNQWHIMDLLKSYQPLDDDDV